MAFFHRDKQILSVEVDEGRLRQLIQMFEQFRATVTAELTPEQAAAEWVLSYIVRFDEKGYRVFSGAEVVDLFNQANVVERVVLALDSKQSIASNRQSGTWVEVKLDAFAIGNCWVNVTSDSKANVDAAYQAIDDMLDSARTRYGLVRSVPARFGIQIVGVVLALVASIWAGSAMVSRLAIQNAFPIAFLFAFLVLSNAWTFFHPGVLSNLDKLFPNIYFKRTARERWTWLWQGLVVAVFISVLTGVFLFALHYAVGQLAPLVKQGPAAGH